MWTSDPGVLVWLGHEYHRQDCRPRLQPRPRHAGLAHPQAHAPRGRGEEARREGLSPEHRPARPRDAGADAPATDDAERQDLRLLALERDPGVSRLSPRVLRKAR